MKAKYLVLLLLVLPVAAALAAGQGEAQKAVTLSMWGQGAIDPSTNPIVKTGIDLFKKNNPGSDVAVQTKGRPEEFYDALNVAISAGNPPDVFYSNVGQVMSFYTKNGKIEKLDPYARKLGWYDEYPKGLFDLQRAILGDVYGLPQYVYVMGLWYNKAVLAQYNLAEPKTYQELLADCATLKANGVVPMAMAGKWPAIITRLLDAQLDMTLGAAAHDAMFTGKTHFDNPGIAKAFRMLKEDWVDKGYFQEGYLSAEEGDVYALWYPGKAAFWYSGTWEIGGFKTNNLDVNNFDFMGFPTGVSPYRINTFGDAWWMPTDGKHHDAVAQLINALTNIDVQKSELVATGDSPGLPNRRDAERERACREAEDPEDHRLLRIVRADQRDRARPQDDRRVVRGHRQGLPWADDTGTGQRPLGRNGQGKQLVQVAHPATGEGGGCPPPPG